MSAAVPQIVLGVVAVAAIVAIVALTLKLLSGGGGGSPGTGPCRNGTYVSLGSTAENALIGLQKKNLIDDWRNTYYVNNQTIEDVIYSSDDRSWGYCKCEDPSSGRTVATGKTCEQELSNKDCSLLTRAGGHSQTIDKARAVPLKQYGKTAEVKATSSKVCGCEHGFGWDDDMYACSSPALTCQPTSDDPLRESCGNVAGLNVLPVNDWDEYSTCCCKGCADCFQEGRCQCGNHANPCVELGKTKPDLIKSDDPRAKRAYPHGWPGISLSPRVMTSGGCVCPGDDKPLSEVDLPPWVFPIGKNGRTIDKPKTELICAPTWRDIWSWGEDGGVCCGGVSWNSKGGKERTGSYDCLCSETCGKGLGGWTMAKDLGDAGEHAYRCCEGHACPGTSGEYACVSYLEYSRLRGDDREGYCQNHCKDLDDAIESLGCMVSDGKNNCCPQCTGTFVTYDGSGKKQQKCCDQYSSISEKQSCKFN